MEKERILKRFAKIVTSETLPPPRFGHTVNTISKTTICIFGGAISTPGNYTMTADLYIYIIPLNQWKKLETSHASNIPHARAAHASAAVRDNQILFYGGSIGNGQYAQDDLWFLDIKSNEEASWMKVPIEGPTPGPRYGHSMVYIQPLLVLFGGSVGGPNTKNEIMNDVWVFGTDTTPFKWIKVNTKGTMPSSRLYHSSCLFGRTYMGTETMVLFGGRDNQSHSLKDVNILKKDNKNEYEWIPITSTSNEVVPIARHQHCSAIFGPFLLVVGGRTVSNQQATFDVFSFNCKKWFRFGTIGLFRHSIWVYFNVAATDNVDLYLYIYGGFDSENNSMINEKLYRINLIELFSKNELLKNELIDYIKGILKKMAHNNNHHQGNEDSNRNHFELNAKVVVYNIPEENNLGTLIKEISYTKLTEADKKISDKPNVGNNKKKTEYDEDNVKEFLQLLTNPDEDFIPLTPQDKPIILNKDCILKLISDCKNQLMKEPTVLNLRPPIKIFGNINGQYNDLMRFFSLFGRPNEFKGDIECMDYLFLGNIVNRGAFSLETLCLLLALKIKYNNNFHILRGSQDDMEISKHYGLAEECKTKLGENINDSKSIYKKICELFEYLPLAAVINNQILCVHSGIGEHIKKVSDMNLKKPYVIQDSIIAQEVLWSTPITNNTKDDYTGDNITTALRTKHYDENIVKEFLSQNKLKMIVRSHDVCDSGMEKLYGDKVITIFSATNYCGIYKNNGAILLIKKSYELQPKILTYEENYPVWLKDNWNAKECPPSPKRNYK